LAASPYASGSRLQFADGLRGLAIFLVLVRHFYMHAYDRGFPRWADFLGLSYVGIHLFLPLSGFSIAWGYMGLRKRKFDVGDFAFRRAIRILPIYYVGMLLMLPMNLGLPFPQLLWQVVTHLLLIHNWFPSTVLAYNGPFWSLALEVQMYFLFPLMLLGGLRWGFGKMLATFFMLQTIYRIAVLPWGTDYNTSLAFVLPWGTLGRMAEYAAGVWAASVIAKWMTPPLPDTEYPTSSPRPLHRTRTLLSLAAPLLFGVAILFKRKLGITHPVTDLFVTTSALCLIFAASGGAGVLARFAKWRPLCALGLMSYSVFIVHVLVLGFLTHPLHDLLGRYVGTVGIMPFVLAPTIFVSWVFFKLVEQPLSNHFYQVRKRRDARRSELAAQTEMASA
jgi:peptidoglycan/LPS O-acetylase OafA/YrhL